MKRLRKKLNDTFNSINMKLAIVFMLMLLATIEVIGAYFTRQLEQTSIENFQSSIQIQTVVSNQLANQLDSDRSLMTTIMMRSVKLSLLTTRIRFVPFLI